MLTKPQPPHPRQTGGGPSPPDTIESVIDLTKNTTSITNFENAIYPSNTETVGVLQIATQLSAAQPWRPSNYLPTKKGTIYFLYKVIIIIL